MFTERSVNFRVPHMRQRLYRMKPQWSKARERIVWLQLRLWSLYVQALRRAPSRRSLGRQLEASSRAGSSCTGGTGGTAQNEVTQSLAATVNADHKTIATSGAVGYAVRLRVLSQASGFSASAPVVPMLSGPMPNPLQGLPLKSRGLNW